MEKELLGWVVLILFLGGIVWLVNTGVERKRHTSRPRLKSLLFVLGSLVLCLIACFAIVGLVTAVFNPPRNAILASAGVGVIAIALVRVWSWSVSKIANPVPGYSFENTKTQEKETVPMIAKSVYLQKYKVTEKKLLAAIGVGKVRSSIESGELRVEDKKV